MALHAKVNLKAEREADSLDPHARGQSRLALRFPGLEGSMSGFARTIGHAIIQIQRLDKERREGKVQKEEIEMKEMRKCNETRTRVKMLKEYGRKLVGRQDGRNNIYKVNLFTFNVPYSKAKTTYVQRISLFFFFLVHKQNLRHNSFWV
eukprot:TRINITY_DN3140_c0_g5_i1.p2 TRINITY_DN3140_c0_g5~~TRINITY_DN3140_c0_g5_i1.p2  ORF type:complete len:149 (+),score=2.48 TRINITY_DN3140_c0_g5_i1:163-609(+)